MAFNPSRFHCCNIVDACAIWNILSSTILYEKAKMAGVNFICTRYVIYECLSKPRTTSTKSADMLTTRLIDAQKHADFQPHDLQLEDLQEYDILQKRKRLGKGELASIVFAKKIRQEFLTDDQKARKLSSEILTPSFTQTTPHMLGWLAFQNKINSTEKNEVIREHCEFERPLAMYFDETFSEGCRCRDLACLQVPNDTM